MHSDSVDQLDGLQTSGDLPPVVTVLDGQDGGPGTSEGTGLQQVLAATALDIEAPGRDRDSGWGIFQARDAVGATVPTAFECTTEKLALTGRPNDGPQTFRACKTLRASDGVFDEVTGLAETVALGDGFVSSESVWSNDLP